MGHLLTFSLQILLLLCSNIILANASITLYTPSSVEWAEDTNYATNAVYRFSAYNNYGQSYTTTFTLDSQSSQKFLVNTTGKPSSYNTTGAVYARQDLCYDNGPSYAITITARDNAGYSDSESTTVKIIQASQIDATVQFENPSPVATISENLETPAYVTTVSVTGANVSLLDIQRIPIFLENDYNGLFVLDTFIVNDAVKHANLTTTRPLDYEDANVYILVVKAPKDGNHDLLPCQQYIQATVTVLVADQDDQPPQFSTVYPFTPVPENAPIGHTVLTVKATDGDRGIRNSIAYSLEPGDKSDWFKIGSSSGVITVNKLLDREYLDKINEVVSLYVKATEVLVNQPGPAKTTTILLLIGLGDINDCPPKFSKPSYIAKVEEDAAIGRTLDFGVGVVLSVKDLDKDGNATFNVYIQDTTDSFTVTPTNGSGAQLFVIQVTKQNFDYDVGDRTMSLKLIAEDDNDRTLFSTATVTVSVLDANDNLPILSSSSYCNGIPENSPVGTTVCRIQATDSDQIDSSAIRYTQLLGQFANGLNLDSATGYVTVSDSSVFDYERDQTYEIIAEIRDEYGLGNAITVEMGGEISDVNDNPPYFLPSPSDVIFENATDFVSEFTVQAKDVDSGTNGIVNYRLVSNVNSNYFKIVPGYLEGDPVAVIKPLQSMDSDSISSCTGQEINCHLPLVVQAYDSGSSSRSASVTVTAVIARTCNGNQ